MEWTLHRLGVSEPSFALQPHLSVVTCGRAEAAHKQLKASHVSRRHCEFRRVTEDGDREYWRLADVGSSSGTYLNRVALPPSGAPARLNDRDLVGVGSNPSRQECRGLKKIFLYEVRAPERWGDEQAEDGEEAINTDAVTPPPSEVSDAPSPVKQESRDDRWAEPGPSTSIAEALGEDADDGVSPAKKIKVEPPDVKKKAPKDGGDPTKSKPKKVKREGEKSKKPKDCRKGAKKPEKQAEKKPEEEEEEEMDDRDEALELPTLTVKMPRRLLDPPPGKGYLRALVDADNEFVEWIDEMEIRERSGKPEPRPKRSRHQQGTPSPSPPPRRPVISSDEDEAERQQQQPPLEPSPSSSPRSPVVSSDEERDPSASGRESPEPPSRDSPVRRDDSGSDSDAPSLEEIPRAFSQIEEVIVIDSDTEYYQASQSASQVAVKAEPGDSDGDDSLKFSDDDDELHLEEDEAVLDDEQLSKAAPTLSSLPPGLLSSSTTSSVEDSAAVEDVVCLEDDDLDSSQMPLFERLSQRIKQEREDEQVPDDVPNDAQNSIIFQGAEDQEMAELGDAEEEKGPSEIPKEDEETPETKDNSGNNVADESFDLDEILKAVEEEEVAAAAAAEKEVKTPPPSVAALYDADTASSSEGEDAGGKESGAAAGPNGYKIPKKKPAGDKKGVSGLASHHHLARSGQKQAMMISALPQRPKGRRRRVSEPSAKEQADAAEEEEPQPSTSNNISSSKFYGRKDFAGSAWAKATAYNLKAERMAKLKELEERKKKAEPESPTAKEATGKVPVKIKQSESRSSKLMDVGEVIKPQSRPLSLPPPVSKLVKKKPQRRISVPNPTPVHPVATEASKDPVPGPSGISSPGGQQQQPSPSLFLEDVQRRESEKARTVGKDKIRRTAETVTDAQGRRTIKKMSFKNVLSNVGSQDLSAQPRRSPEKTPRDMMFKVPETTNKKPNKKGHNVTFRAKIADVRFITREGKGNKVSDTRKFDTKMGQANPAPAAPLVQAAGNPLVRAQVTLGQSHLNFTEMLRRILQWHVTWLTEQETMKEAPPVQGELALGHVPSVFDTYNDYCLTYYPLMLLELWSTIFEDYTRHYRDSSPRVMMSLVHQEIQPPQTCLRLFGLLTEQERRRDNFLPTEGLLCKLDLRCRKDVKWEIRPVFAYVTSARVRKRSPGGDEAYVKSLVDESIPARRKHLKFVMEATVLVKRLADGIVLDGNKPMLVTAVARIRPSLRTFEAVEKLTYSPLFGAIVSPRNFLQNPAPPGTAATDNFRPDLINCPLVQRLNPFQADTVKRVALHCTNFSPAPTQLELRQGRLPLPRPSVSLVQGPPGTGKTDTIAALVLQIYSRWRHLWPGLPLPRIMLCAPSNAAVDEMALRVSSAAGRSITLMRLGQEKSISPKMKHLTLETLLEKEMTRRTEERLAGRSNARSINSEVHDRQEKINELGKRLEGYARQNNRDQMALMTRKIKEETERLNRARKAASGASLQLSDKERVVLKRECTDHLFNSADVLAVTLGSSMAGQMVGYFFHSGPRFNAGRFRRVAICVVDEASQCVEPEALVPLGMGFEKMVLVGDPEQLPATVSSRAAKKGSLDASLFSRLFRALENKDPGGAVHKLKVQYRMHDEICRWPNKYFYGGMLQTGPQARDGPLRPYTLLDLKTSRERQEGPSLWNEEEARLVCKIVRLVETEKLRAKLNYGISVITFYSKQVARIEDELRGQGLAGRAHVRTVDAFQGSESDVVIISCVRSRRGGSIGFVAESERLNVALTRARHCLVVVGNFEALKVDMMWRSLWQDAVDRGCFLRLPNCIKKFSLTKQD